MQLESKKFSKKAFFFALCQKKNLNGKKRMLSNQNNLSSDFIQGQSFPQIFFSLLNKSENNVGIYNYIKNFELFETFKIENIGNCYVIISGFGRDKKMLESLKLEIRPKNSKIKVYKFMISTKEIKTYINPKFDQSETAFLLIQINSHLLKNLSLKKENIYKKLCIPFKKISQNSSRKFEDLKMNYPISSQNPNESGYVSPYFNAYRVIFQRMKKIDNMFSIMTVKKHNVFDYWAIFINIPSTARTYFCRLFKSDLIGLSQKFFDETYPIQMSDLRKIFEKKYEVNYHEFSVKYEKLLDTGKTFTRPASIYFEDDYSISMEEKDNKYNKFSLKKYMNFIEAKVIKIENFIIFFIF